MMMGKLSVSAHRRVSSEATGTHRAVQNGPVGPLGR